jgi:hypothetical protein
MSFTHSPRTMQYVYGSYYSIENTDCNLLCRVTKNPRDILLFYRIYSKIKSFPKNYFYSDSIYFQRTQRFFIDLYDALSYIFFMKVTALIPDDLVKDVKHFTGGKNTTESLITALEEWLSLKKIQSLNEDIVKKPLEFYKNFSASKNREINRRQ